MRLSFRQKRRAVAAVTKAVVASDAAFLSHDAIMAKLAECKAELATVIKGSVNWRSRRKALKGRIMALTVAAGVTPKTGIAPKRPEVPSYAPGCGVDEWRDRE